MNRPSSSDALLGSRAGIILTTGATAVTGLAASRQAVSWFVPVIGVLSCSAAFSARGRVETYRRWRETFDAMGQPPALFDPAAANEPQPRPAASGRTRRLLGQVLLVTWAVLLYYLVTHTRYGATEAYGALFLAWLGLSAIGLLRVAIAILVPSRERTGGPPAPQRDRAAATAGSNGAPAIVEQCLPPYCHDLLNQEEPEAGEPGTGH
jgi:hypothetical protein